MNADAPLKSESSWSLLLKRITEGRRLRIFIIPTWYCVLFNFLILFMMIYGFSNRSGSIVFSGFFIVFIEILSMIEAHVNVREMALHVADCPPVEAGGKGVLTLKARSENQSFGVQLYAIKFEDKGQRNWLGRRSRGFQQYMRQEFAEAWIFWRTRNISADLVEAQYAGQDSLVPLPFQSLARGVHGVPRVVASSMFPFGMFRVWREYSFGQTYVSYPRPVGVPFSEQNIAKQNAEASVSSFGKVQKSVETEYLHHREFAGGDSLRRIDWKASSRRGIKIVKVFSGINSGEARAFRWAETRSSDWELRLQQMSYWVHEAHHDQVSFRIELPEAMTSFGTGERHKDYCLSLLASFEIPRNSSSRSS